MKLHLNYDGKQSNGIIFNSSYAIGAMYIGAHLKPITTFNYDSFQFSEVFDTLDYVELDGVKRVMTPEQQNEVAKLAFDWMQEEGQEGNPTLEQLKFTQKEKVTADSETDSRTPVTYEGNEFNGGESSARAVDDVVSLSEKSNTLLGTTITEVTITDTSNNPIVLGLVNAQILALTIASVVEQNFQRKQSLKVAIDNTTTKPEVLAIVW